MLPKLFFLSLHSIFRSFRLDLNSQPIEYIDLTGDEPRELSPSELPFSARPMPSLSFDSPPPVPTSTSYSLFSPSPEPPIAFRTRLASGEIYLQPPPPIRLSYRDYGEGTRRIGSWRPEDLESNDFLKQLKKDPDWDPQ